ncbi:uncharacterized protein isoform X2 [Musca autumnalis]|uniref:uncharacterized protein isoform X2 n=1 Tax=Musca autumnalis TaxID=221902 RepID=UPI003CEBFC88
MDMCLLCLELRHESVDCIYVASEQWQENNVEQLIEQHFWPLDSIKPNSWMCVPCFHILNEFHKFYLRIEEAHVDFAMSMKTVTTGSSPEQLPPEQNDFEELIDKDIRSIDIVLKFKENNEDESENEHQKIEAKVTRSRKEMQSEKMFQKNVNEFSTISEDSQKFRSGDNNSTHFPQSPLQNTSDFQLQENQENDLLVQEELNRLLEESFREDSNALMHDIRSDGLSVTTDVIDADQQQQLMDLLGDEILDSLSRDFLENQNQMQPYNSSKEGQRKLEAHAGSENRGNQVDFSLGEYCGKNILNNQNGGILGDSLNQKSQIVDQEETSTNRLDIMTNHEKSTTNLAGNDKDEENSVLSSKEVSTEDKEDECMLENKAIDEEPIIYDESKPRKRKDPLEKNVFSKIPKIVIKVDEVVNESGKNSNFGFGEELIDDGKEQNNTQCKSASKDLKTNTKDIPKRNRKSKRIESKKESNEMPQTTFQSTKENTSNTNDKQSEQEKSESETNFKNANEKPRRSLRKLSTRSISSNEFSSYSTSSQISLTETENSMDGLEMLPLDENPTRDTNSDSQNDTDPSAHSSAMEEHTKLTRKEYDSFLANNFRIHCDICKEESKTFLELRRHFKTVHNEQAYVLCCDRKFLRRFHLVEHIRSHSDTYSYKCKYCEKVMSTKRCLQLHEKHVHEKEYKRHICDICGKAFVSACVLKKHKLIHLSEEEKQFKCDECGKRYGSKPLLDDHVRTIHMEKYVKICDICGMVLRKQDAFERHMVKHSDKPITYKRCEICGTRFIHERALRSHMALKHPEGGVVEYTCDICGKVSINLRNHRRHVQYNHQMTSKYECNLCPKKFKQRTALKDHLAYHSQTPLYTCTYCPMKFISNGNMHAHRKNAHPLEWLEDRRAKYSGKLPPNHIPPSTLPRDESDSACDS